MLSVWHDVRYKNVCLYSLLSKGVTLPAARFMFQSSFINPSKSIVLKNSFHLLAFFPLVLFSSKVEDFILVLSPSYAGGSWKRRFNYENACNVFRPHYADGIWKRQNYRCFWLCVWLKHGQGNHIIDYLTSSFSKIFVFKMFSLHS